MRFKEQKLWDAMSNGTPARVRLYRLENVAGVGTPDVMALASGVVTFCELKATAALPKRPTTRVLGEAGLSVAQRNWHMGWHQSGGRALIVVGVGAGVQRQHVALEGRHGDRVNAMTWDELLRNACCAGVGAAFWPKLTLILEGKLT